MKLLIIVIMAAITIALTVAANLFLKKGANEPSSTLILGFIGWKTLAGWTAFGLALIAYTLLLRYVRGDGVRHMCVRLRTPRVWSRGVLRVLQRLNQHLQRVRQQSLRVM